MGSYAANSADSYGLSFQEIIKVNRSHLLKSFTNSSYIVQNENSKVSVAWIKVPDGIKSSNLCSWLEEKGIFTLPGSPFYWNDPSIGESYFRVALARPTDFFEKTVAKLAKACRIYTQ